ncbi:molybdopterin converting factor [Euryarchaeota archaeon ex4484_178]|nr:MAG: molybdopterin converting factor [Euryarchaeota archaeon ex4484_178]
MIILGQKEEGDLLKIIVEKKGSVVAYFGYVRDFAHGHEVKGMIVKETEKTKSVMERIEKELREKFSVSVHRKEGFEACRYGIDRIKEEEPAERGEILGD